MKRTTNLILTGIIVLLGAGLVGTLLYIQSRPAPERGFQPLVDIAPMEPDSSRWGINFPNEYSSFLKTLTNDTRTTYGGSEKFSHLTEDPRQVILFAGYGFGKDYNEERGHLNSLTDVNETKRIDEKTPGTCYSCKSANNPELWTEMGMAAFDKTPFSELGQQIDQPIGCANCHEVGTMRLIVTNPALEEALMKLGIDWRTLTRQEMRTVVCANCHVEYYFAGEGKYLTFPWADGTRVEAILSYYEELGFSDWTYPDTGTSMLKAQHPEYEFYTAESTHFSAGVACADCHMPYLRDGAVKYSSHDVKSPLLFPEQACGQCHTDVNYVVARVCTIQDQVHTIKITAENAIIDAIKAIEAAAQLPEVNQDLLEEARFLHWQAQFRWDFVSAENSMGFHNPEEALRILADATNLARQAQMKAAQAAGNYDLLITDVYTTIDSPSTPEP
ncbi:MAG: ammonia-forming cytochrome c nitrite reductase subunit c552 [Chloroflexota bacterium]